MSRSALVLAALVACGCEKKTAITSDRSAPVTTVARVRGDAGPPLLAPPEGGARDVYSAPADDAGIPLAQRRELVPAADAQRVLGEAIVRVDDAAGFFTPSKAEADAFERKLFERIAREAQPHSGAVPRPPLAERAPRYTRHVVGWVDARSRRRLTGFYRCHVIMFRDAPDAWRRLITLPNDGGDCFFDATYAIDEDRVTGWAANGDD